MHPTRVPGSFRDPSGFLFTREGRLYRQIAASYAPHWEMAASSGLHDELIGAGLLVRHDEVGRDQALTPGAWKVICPERVPFVSYPYEWCFGQLKAAALLTLDIQERALAKGMVLRDASAYNVQFHEGRPVLIDTLSLGTWTEGEPWVAYQQFCRHFLAPLALMARTDVALGQLLRVWIDGVPLDLASALLPFGTKLRLPLLTHIHLHARASRRHGASEEAPGRNKVMSHTAMLGLADHLKTAVSSLEWTPSDAGWGDYYANTNYTEAAHAAKRKLVAALLAKAKARGPLDTVWDLGANTGLLSRVAADAGAHVVAFDVDPSAVEHHHRDLVARKETRILPLLQDLTNPSAGIGWDHHERQSLVARGPADVVLALALVHHLAIANNVPLDRVASFLHRIGRRVVIEFVPKRDSQVQRLLATREDVFPDYTEAGFELAFSRRFDTLACEPIPGSDRTLWLFEAR